MVLSKVGALELVPKGPVLPADGKVRALPVNTVKTTSTRERPETFLNQVLTSPNFLSI